MASRQNGARTPPRPVRAEDPSSSTRDPLRNRPASRILSLELALTAAPFAR